MRVILFSAMTAEILMGTVFNFWFLWLQAQNHILCEPLSYLFTYLHFFCYCAVFVLALSLLRRREYRASVVSVSLFFASLVVKDFIGVTLDGFLGGGYAIGDAVIYSVLSLFTSTLLINLLLFAACIVFPYFLCLHKRTDTGEEKGILFTLKGNRYSVAVLLSVLLCAVYRLAVSLAGVFSFLSDIYFAPTRGELAYIVILEVFLPLLAILLAYLFSHLLRACIAAGDEKSRMSVGK